MVRAPLEPSMIKLRAAASAWLRMSEAARRIRRAGRVAVDFMMLHSLREVTSGRKRLIRARLPIAIIHIPSVRIDYTIPHCLI
jgi:hypothetical protein